MSQWVERIRGHAVFAELAALEQSVEAARDGAREDTINFEAWQRIERVTNFIRTFLAELDPLLVPPSHLANAIGQIQQARSQLGSFVSSRNIAHLNEANNNFDNILTYLGGIPRLDKKTSIQELSSVATAYRKSVAGMVGAIENQVTKVETEKSLLETRIQELTTEVALLKQRADNVITQMQQQFSSAQETRQIEGTASEAKRASEFEVAEKARAKEDGDAKVLRQKDFDELLFASKGAHESLCVDLARSSKASIESLEIQKARAEKVVGIISIESMAHGYGKTANEERDAAKLWRIVATSALVVWIIAGLVFFGLTYDKELSISALARQFLISMPFVLLAGFAALQVSKHQRVERFSRQQELEIAAIDPYLATFDDSARNDVKRQLAEKLFGQREVEPVKGDSKQAFDAISDTLKTVKQIQEALKK
jgi:hypothetical protein